MFKFIFIVVLLFFGLIYFGNYLDYKHNRISRVTYERKIRLSIVLLIILAAGLIYLRKRY